MSFLLMQWPAQWNIRTIPDFGLVKILLTLFLSVFPTIRRSIATLTSINIFFNTSFFASVCRYICKKMSDSCRCILWLDQSICPSNIHVEKLEKENFRNKRSSSREQSGVISISLKNSINSR